MSEKGVPNTSINNLDEPLGLDSFSLVEDATDISLSEHVKLHIQETIDKQFQSAKDKRWDKLEKQVKQMQAQNQPTPKVSNDEGKSFDTKAANLLIKIGLDNNVEANALLAQYLEKGDDEEMLPFVEDVLQLVMQSAQPTPASPASLTQPGGSQAPSISLESMYQQAKSLIKPGDLLGLLAIKREYRQKGLDIF